jgi:hypothetical protein
MLYHIFEFNVLCVGYLLFYFLAFNLFAKLGFFRPGSRDLVIFFDYFRLFSIIFDYFRLFSIVFDYFRLFSIIFDYFRLFLRLFSITLPLSHSGSPIDLYR